MRESDRKNVVEESDIVVPDVHRALALGLDPQIWADAQALATLLDGRDLENALRLVEIVHGLGYLLMGAAGPEALGLSQAECARILALLEG